MCCSGNMLQYRMSLQLLLSRLRPPPGDMSACGDRPDRARHRLETLDSPVGPFPRSTVPYPLTVYCALEEKLAEVKQHLRGLGAREDDPLYINVAAALENAMTWLIQAAQTYSPTLIIVDTWHRLTRVSDVNDYAAVNHAMEPLVSLARESGAHLAFTHHGRKGDGAHGDNVLGSTALFGAVDTLVEMRRSERRTLWSIQRAEKSASNLSGLPTAQL